MVSDVVQLREADAFGPLGFADGAQQFDALQLYPSALAEILGMPWTKPDTFASPEQIDPPSVINPDFLQTTLPVETPIQSSVSSPPVLDMTTPTQ